MISDHNLIYAIQKIPLIKARPRVIESRQYRDFNQRKFKEDLMSIPWESIDSYSDPNLAWKIWKETFLSICNLHAQFQAQKGRCQTSSLADFRINVWKRQAKKRYLIGSIQKKAGWITKVLEIESTLVLNLPKKNIISACTFMKTPRT